MKDNFDLQKGDITKSNQIDQNVIGKKKRPSRGRSLISKQQNNIKLSLQ